MRPMMDKDLEVFVDASFCKAAATDCNIARSQHGYVINYEGCPLLWKSQLQMEVALLSTESEYTCCLSYVLVRDVIPVMELLKENGVHTSKHNLPHCITFILYILASNQSCFQCILKWLWTQMWSIITCVVSWSHLAIMWNWKLTFQASKSLNCEVHQMSWKLHANVKTPFRPLDAVYLNLLLVSSCCQLPKLQLKKSLTLTQHDFIGFPSFEPALKPCKQSGM